MNIYECPRGRRIIFKDGKNGANLIFTKQSYTEHPCQNTTVIGFGGSLDAAYENAQAAFIRICNVWTCLDQEAEVSEKT